jgi:predicted metal-binding protein
MILKDAPVISEMVVAFLEEETNFESSQKITALITAINQCGSLDEVLVTTLRNSMLSLKKVLEIVYFLFCIANDTYDDSCTNEVEFLKTPFDLNTALTTIKAVYDTGTERFMSKYAPDEDDEEEDEDEDEEAGCSKS